MILYVKEHQQWYASCRITRSRARRALKILKKKEVVITEVHLFDQKATTYIRINSFQSMRTWQRATSESAQKPLPESAKKSLPESAKKPLPESAEKQLTESAKKSLPESAKKPLPESAEKQLP